MQRQALLSIYCLFVVAATATGAANEVTVPYQGVRLIHSKTTMPRLLDMYIVEIDMAAPGLSFLATPSNGGLVGDTTPQTTRAFVAQHDAQIGINASFFASAGSGQYDVLGLSVSNGDAYSPFQSGFVDALNVSQTNAATIIRATGTSGLGHTPSTALYNAVAGNTRLVTNGVSVANSDPAIHPRTAVGVTADQKLLLITVDGRNTNHSQGVTYRELAEVLIRWGARDAINLDGGGSTTFVMDNPLGSVNDPQVLNIPSDLLANGLPGRERAVANNFAVFASRPTGPTEKTFAFADFEQGDEGPFNADLAFSGSNRGIDLQLSTAEVVSSAAFDGLRSQRLTIVDDPATDGDTLHPGGAWFVRHVSGFGNPANNVSRPAIGSVGLWARTTDANLRISLVVDDASGATGERGLAQQLIADGQWHPYFWDVADSNQWEGWVNGDGEVDGSFTLDSIQIFGPPASTSPLNATVDIDAVSHIMPGTLPGDFNSDFAVDAADYVVWRKGLNTVFTQADINAWREHFGHAAALASASDFDSQYATVPEPASSAFLTTAVMLLCSAPLRCNICWPYFSHVNPTRLPNRPAKK